MKEMDRQRARDLVGNQQWSSVCNPGAGAAAELVDIEISLKISMVFLWSYARALLSIRHG